MKRVKKTRCADCLHFRLQTTGAPVKEKGHMLQSGERYCMAWKRPRRFRPSDPKVYPPKWCPIRISPPILRIYKVSADRRFFHEMSVTRCKRCRLPYHPSPKDFVLRQTGVAPMEAREFYKNVAECRRWECYVALSTLEELLGARICEEEILKFDDGILPIYFYVESGTSGIKVRQIFQYEEGISDEP